jgi:hypothetical protein
MAKTVGLNAGEAVQAMLRGEYVKADEPNDYGTIVVFAILEGEIYGCDVEDAASKELYRIHRQRLNIWTKAFKGTFTIYNFDKDIVIKQSELEALKQKISELELRAA